MMSVIDGKNNGNLASSGRNEIMMKPVEKYRPWEQTAITRKNSNPINLSLENRIYNGQGVLPMDFVNKLSFLFFHLKENSIKSVFS